MKNFTTLLEETLEAWQDARQGVIDELQNIPEEKWDFRPVPGVKSVQELAVHILEVAMLMTGELTRPDTNFKRAPWPELLKMYAAPAYRLHSKKDLLHLLVSQLEEGIKKFQAVGELRMLQCIERFDGKSGTRLAWLNHGIAQEMYHRGQLTLYARLLGLEPALTRKIRGG